ncbi:MAG: S8 family serine peptidase [Bacteroidetes bacterium]|nr:S8 family serine peptidase [Bacteroidota bacterium]
MNKLLTLFCLILLLPSPVFSQVAPKKYFIEFTNKTGTPYTIDHPEAFLSGRAIERRSNQGIIITDEDLPVNPTYVSTIRDLGVTVLNRSKWFNGITIYAADSSVLPLIEALPFVQGVEKCWSSGSVTKSSRNDKFDMEMTSFGPLNTSWPKSTGTLSGFDYGNSYTQIHMINGDVLHNMGYRGEGKVIAILDAGFYNANIFPAFDSLNFYNQILGTRDFVLPGNNVYNEFYHGMSVLSTMGGNIPGQLIGTAPKADYWLLRTEDAATENIIKEYNWVSGAEFADSVGADVINSSLGYTQFDDSTMNHTWADLTGNTTPVTRGANIAAAKGIAVINSAGNSGSSAWHYICFPSDGLNVMAIGAVDSAENRAYFSSYGYVRTEIVKPDIAAMGYLTVLENESGYVGTGSGTSFSSPIIAGMVACLWEANPQATNFRVYQAIRESGNRYDEPDSLTGFGIPDFAKALLNLSIPEKKEYVAKVFPNPFSDHFTIGFTSQKDERFNLDLYDLTGRRVFHSPSLGTRTGENRITIKGLSSLEKGCYLLKYSGEKLSGFSRILKVD